MPNARQTPVNKSHSSLGPNLRPGRLASARRTFERLLTYGIRPDDTVVDYGCGTLRLGTLFIEYLQADRYIGLCIDKRILAAGREQLADDIVETKRPTLEVISKEGLARVAARIRAGFAPSGCCNTCRRKSSTTILRASPLSFMPEPPACCFRISGPKAGECRSRLGCMTSINCAAAKGHGMELGRLKWREPSWSCALQTAP
jgi:hypothetical protein